jgi:hypothetical protein
MSAAWRAVPAKRWVARPERPAAPSVALSVAPPGQLTAPWTARSAAGPAGLGDPVVLPVADRAAPGEPVQICSAASAEARSRVQPAASPASEAPLTVWPVTGWPVMRLAG